MQKPQQPDRPPRSHKGKKDQRAVSASAAPVGTPSAEQLFEGLLDAIAFEERAQLEALREVILGTPKLSRLLRRCTKEDIPALLKIAGEERVEAERRQFCDLVASMLDEAVSRKSWTILSPYIVNGSLPVASRAIRTVLDAIAVVNEAESTKFGQVRRMLSAEAQERTKDLYFSDLPTFDMGLTLEQG
eukprot:m51a1_g12992 hypothetical protein (188) ;mRNA; f:1991-2876